MTSLHYPRAHEQGHVMRIGSSFNKQAPRPTELGAPGGGGGMGLRTSKYGVVVGCV